MAVAWQSRLPWFHISSHAHFNVCFLFWSPRPLSGRKLPWTVPLRPPFVPKTSSAALIVASIVPSALDCHSFRIRSPYPVAPPPHRRLPFSGSSSAATSNRDALLEPGERGAGVAGFSHGVWPISYDNPCQLPLQISVLTWCVSEAALWMWNVDVLWANLVFQAGMSWSKESRNGPSIGYVAW